MTDKQPLGTALITGASSGIGAVYATKLAERGYDLILVARDRLKLEAVATQIGSSTGRSVRFLPSDLTECYDIACIEELLRSDPSITMLVNNAGLGSTASVLEADADRMQTLINLNVIALTRLTYAVVPQFVQRGHGTIINISSIVGRMALPYASSYIATKFAVEGLSESMRYELEPFHIRVKMVEPGSIGTEFGKGSMQMAVSDPYRVSMNKFLGVFAKSNSTGSKPEEVAKVIYRAANDSSNRLRYLAKPGPFYWMNRMLPDAVWRRMLVKAMVR